MSLNQKHSQLRILIVINGKLVLRNVWEEIVLSMQQNNPVNIIYVASDNF